MVGALIGTDRVESAERFPILKIEGQINVCFRARQIQNAYCLMADKFALFGVAHVAVGDHPGLFSLHGNILLCDLL